MEHRANQSAPADLPRGSADWRTDLAAYDALPPELREALREAPFEMDAASLLTGLQAAARHYGSEAMAIAAMGAQVGRFTTAALDAARRDREEAPRSPSPPAWTPPWAAWDALWRPCSPSAGWSRHRPCGGCGRRGRRAWGWPPTGS